jgi:hypothetical protein
MSTLKTTNLQHASAASPAIVLASDGTAAAQVSSLNDGPLSGARNRIINGDMRIDQRNAGASVTNGTVVFYTVDRWAGFGTQASKFTVQQNAGGVAAPAGFTHYAGVTSLSAYTVTGNEAYQFYQIIEGFNVADLNWGTASAVPATLSFWVRSSLTGTFGGSIATTKTSVWSMPFSFTISAANTWTYITVAIPAPTATDGANTGNTGGVFVRFGLGAAGTSAGGTAGVWTNNNYAQPASTVSVVGTNGATFYITGVQLEAGTVATPFERRSFGQELALCQRYLCGVDTRTQSADYHFFGYAVQSSSTSAFCGMIFPVDMRVRPTSIIASAANTFFVCQVTNFTTVTADQMGVRGGYVLFQGGSGVTSNSGRWLSNNNNTAYLYFNAEL